MVLLRPFFTITVMIGVNLMPKPDDLESEIIRLKCMINKMLDDYHKPKTEPFEEIQWFPDMDILEDKDDIIIKIDIPGMSVSDIEITITGGLFQVKGERKREANREDENYHYIGRNYGKFDRSVELPTQVNIDNIKAVYKEGVLTVKLPKIEKTKSEKLKIELK
jgi:HSP20 family protein